MRSRSASLLLVLAACGGGDDGNAQNGGLSPIVDESTGWTRVKSIAPLDLLGADQLELTAVAHADGTFAMFERESRTVAAPAREYVLATFPDDDPANVTSMVARLGDPDQTSSFSFDHTYTFVPGTLDIVQTYRESQGETWSGLRYADGVTAVGLRSPGGGQFAGVSDVYAGGTAVMAGTELSSAYLHDGAWQRIYGRYSDINEPQTSTSCPVKLADGTLIWGMLQADFDGPIVAVGTLVPGATTPADEQVKTQATVHGNPLYYPSDCYARPTEDGIVFVTSSILNDAPTYSAYRWSLGAATIEILWSDVTLMTTQRLPSHLDRGDRQWQLTSDGTLTYFATPIDNVTGTDLIRVDGTGAHVLATIPAGPWFIQGPWLLDDGKQYAGIGANSGRDVIQLDLVRASL